MVSLPGAFTPTCSANHVPRYIEHIADLSESLLCLFLRPGLPSNVSAEKKGVEQLIIIAPNDAFVMSGWQKVNLGSTDEDNEFTIFASDLETNLAKQIGWTAQGDASRNGRFAAIIDHGKVTYAGFETELQTVSVSGVDAVLEKL